MIFTESIPRAEEFSSFQSEPSLRIAGGAPKAQEARPKSHGKNGNQSIKSMRVLKYVFAREKPVTRS